MDLWFDLGHLIQDFVFTKISFQSYHENYQSQNLHNEQVALNGAQVNETVENSGGISNTGEVEESVLDSTNNANLEQTVENQSDSQNEAPAPAFGAIIDEFNFPVTCIHFIVLIGNN